MTRDDLIKSIKAHNGEDVAEEISATLCEAIYKLQLSVFTDEVLREILQNLQRK
jgi:hypothetical protein